MYKKNYALGTCCLLFGYKCNSFFYFSNKMHYIF